MKIEQYQVYRGIFQPRRVDDLKPGALPLVGCWLTVEASWVIDDEDGGPYIGEWAMSLVGSRYSRLRFFWIPSGDLANLQLTPEELLIRYGGVHE